jgi:hypothetical protein
VAQVDEDALKNYLVHLFAIEDSNGAKVHESILELQRKVHVFEHTLSSPGQFNENSLSWTIDGLLASDLLTDDKREVLRDFKNNPTILLEIADLLNMPMASLDTWSWGTEVLLEERRSISGVYNIVMHEDLLQAIFLQYIGVQWFVFFKSAFGQFRSGQGAWKPMAKTLATRQREKLSYYLGHLSEAPSLHSQREKHYLDDYFVAQMLANSAQRC